MALDTKEKRAAVFGVGRPWMRDKFPVATPDEEWRIASGNAYGGNALSAPIVVISVFHDILTTVQTAIQALSLDGINSGNIELVKVNPERETVLPGIPGILILPIGEEGIPIDGGTLRRDDVGYPVGIIMIDIDRQSSETGTPADADEGTVDQDYAFNTKLLWRERIRKKFIRQKLTGVASVYNCEIEPDVVVDPTALLGDNLWMGTLVLRFLSRETRGS